MNARKIIDAPCPMPNTPKNIRNKIALIVKRQSVKHFLLCSEDRLSDRLR
ncbi:MAG: hypothetical protein V7K67_24510 [Nostoc sp.]